MFRSITKTWNPWTGCRHGCIYCWARPLALQFQEQGKAKYSNGFEPTFHEKELEAKFKPGEFIFVSSMGDLFGDWVPSEQICQVLDVISRFRDTNFLLQTKNPARFSEFIIPRNAYAGVTIETDVPYLDISKAPQPFSRYRAMVKLTNPPMGVRKFLSIEPIMSFTIDGFTKWIADIKPSIIEVGADNHGHNLPEPSWEKVEELLRRLREICPDVKEKDGLERLKQEMPT